MRFRKLPVTIDAIQVSHALMLVKDNFSELPQWLQDDYEEGNIIFGSHFVNIPTKEGLMLGSKDDWIIRGVCGELYPCKPDIFAKTYEQVE